METQEDMAAAHQGEAMVEICKDGEFWLLDLTIRKVALKKITSYFDKGPSKI
jgi:hypothetical protein